MKPDDKVALMEGTTAIIAGADTTSTIMSHTLHFLMKYPETLRRVQTEVDGIFGGDGDRPDYTRTAKTPYLMACMYVAHTNA